MSLDQTDYHLRNTATVLTELTLPKSKREFLRRSLKFSGAMLWNQLPNEAKLAESISLFKSLIRLWLGLDKLCILIAVIFLYDLYEIATVVVIA